jgi:hypothetical protein
MLDLVIVVVRALHVAAPRPSGIGLGKPGIAATTGGLSPNDAMPPPRSRPTLLDGSRAKLAELAHRVDCRATGHRHPLASRLAPPPLDAPLTPSTGWPSVN